MEFIGVPFVEQEDEDEVDDKGSLKFNGFWLEIIPGAQKWFRKMKRNHCMVNVVDTDVDMNPVSPSNMLPSRVSRYVNQQTAVKISENSHISFLMKLEEERH